jgi:uncharacterized protein YjaG (DUF416 family)
MQLNADREHTFIVYVCDRMQPNTATEFCGILARDAC